MTQSPQSDEVTERISITIDKRLLRNLDEYVGLQKTISRSVSRSGVIRDLIQKYVPVQPQ